MEIFAFMQTVKTKNYIPYIPDLFEKARQKGGEH